MATSDDDPDLQARLRAWFSPDGTSTAADDGSAEPDGRATVTASRRAEALGAVDAMLVAGIYASGQQRAALGLHADWTPNQRPQWAPRVMDTVSVLREPEERQRPPDLSEAMNEQVPQALLRDLHRPVLAFERVFETNDELKSLVPVNAADEARAAMAIIRGMPTERAWLGALADVRAARTVRSLPWRSLGKAES